MTIRKHSSLRPAGVFEITMPDGPSIRGEGLQCVHCGMHWHIQPGSGITRGFCMKCNGPTCGGPGCIDCVPWEKRLEIQEGSRKPSTVSVPVGDVTKLWLS